MLLLIKLLGSVLWASLSFNGSHRNTWGKLRSQIQHRSPSCDVKSPAWWRFGSGKGEVNRCLSMAVKSWLTSRETWPSSKSRETSSWFLPISAWWVFVHHVGGRGVWHRASLVLTLVPLHGCTAILDGFLALIPIADCYFLSFFFLNKRWILEELSAFAPGPKSVDSTYLLNSLSK